MRRSPQAKEYVRSLDQAQASLAPLSDRGGNEESRLRPDQAGLSDGQKAVKRRQNALVAHELLARILRGTTKQFKAGRSVMRSLRELEVFAAVAERGSITGAARSVGMSTPSVSKWMTELESDLGTALFLRTTHRVTLTEAGSIFYERCVGILASLDDAKNEVAQSSHRVSGRIRIHSGLCIGQMLVAPCLAQFVDANPSVSVSHTLTPGPIQMSRFDLDLIIRSGSHAPEAGYKQRALTHLPYVICASPKYLAKSPKVKAAQNLAAHNCLIHTTQEDPNCWTISEPSGDAHISVHGNFASNASMAVRSAALAGVGIARLPTYMVASEIGAGSLVSLFPGQVLSRRVVSAFYPRSNRPPAKITALLDFLADNISQPDTSRQPPAGRQLKTCESAAIARLPRAN
jgi:DNA-binding transcriptional LysR family regulator